MFPLFVYARSNNRAMWSNKRLGGGGAVRPGLVLITHLIIPRRPSCLYRSGGAQTD